MSHKFMPFSDFIEHLDTLDKPGWLYMPMNCTWTMDTEALIIYDEYGEQEGADLVDATPRVAVQKNLESTVSIDIIEDVIDNLDLRDVPLNFEMISKALRYYHLNDAFIEINCIGT